MENCCPGTSIAGVLVEPYMGFADVVVTVLSSNSNFEPHNNSLSHTKSKFVNNMTHLDIWIIKLHVKFTVCD